jgi:hypothetical protein
MSSFTISSTASRTVGATTDVQISATLKSNIFETGDILRITVQSPGKFNPNSGDASKCKTVSVFFYKDSNNMSLSIILMNNGFVNRHPICLQ